MYDNWCRIAIVKFSKFKCTDLTARINISSCRYSQFVVSLLYSSKFRGLCNKAKINIKIIRWYGINPVKINDQNALEISYLRQLGNNPYFAVRAYYFENNDREHLVTVSYRLSDEKVWKPLFIKSLKSLKIINR